MGLTAMARRFGKAAGIRIDAEDIVQEAFVTLWQLSEQGYPVRDSEALLARITKVACISRLRKHKLGAVPLEDALCVGRESALEEVEKMDEAVLKEKLFECLTGTQREYMAMKTEEGMTLDEIARRTGVRKPLISTALSKARKKIEGQLKKLGYDR